MAQSTPALADILSTIGKTFDVEFETLNADGQTLEVLAIKNMQGHIDGLLRKKAIHDPLRDLPLWAKIWPASFVLGRFLRKFQPEGKTMLEIGAGMGICSLVAAKYGFKSIVASDMQGDALNFARANALRNGLDDIVSVRHLDIMAPWREETKSQFDMIAASEILYLDDLHRPLLKFARSHLAPGGKAFFCSDLTRARSRFKKLASREFKITDGNIGVKCIDDDGSEKRNIYNIIILEK